MGDKPVATRIILARHGEATYPKNMSTSGGILTELGRRQAHQLGQSLRGKRIVAVCSSALSRAQQTATIAAEVLGRSVQMRQGLEEYQLGDDPPNAGQLEAALLAWLDGRLQAELPGGENGYQISRRMLEVLNDLARQFEGSRVMVVSHGGAIIATLGAITPGRTGLPASEDGQLREQDIPGGGAFMLERTEQGWDLVGRMLG